MGVYAVEDAGRAGTWTRVTLRDASQVLGISPEAVRKRAKRGSLRSEKGPDGKVYVRLDPSPTASPTVSAPGHEDVAPLVEEMRGRIEDLRTQLAAEREANRENRRIIAMLTSRVPELEAPQSRENGPGGPRTAPEGSEPRPDTGGAQEGAEQPRRSWWRRVFGG